MLTGINKKLVYPIAKNKVVSVTRVADHDPFDAIKNAIGNSSYTVYSWALTADDYIVGRDPFTNGFSQWSDDTQLYCFICY